MDLLTQYLSLVNEVKYTNTQLEEYVTTVTKYENRDAVTKATDFAISFTQQLQKLENLNKDFATIIKQSKTLTNVIITTQRKNHQNEIEEINSRDCNKSAKSWADMEDEVDDDFGEKSWATITKRNSKCKAEPNNNFNIPTESVELCEGGLSLTLPVVENDKQLYNLPCGMLVYHKGKTVPKIVLSTGTHTYPSVPLGCRIWDSNDKETQNKYSLYNHRIKKNNTPDVNNFYVDERCANLLDIPEDVSRNFRPPSRTVSDSSYKNWSGYSVYKKPNFGDSKLLNDQIRDVNFDETKDLYQYNLWMVLVSLLHHQNR
jgi:hypothetical protein